MIGLIIKDIFNLKKSITTTLVVILAVGFFAYNTGDMSMLMGVTTFIMASMSVSSIAYDDMAKWDSYALAMPVSRKSIVFSKYALSLILGIIATIVTSIFSIVVLNIKGDLKGIANIQEIFLTSYIVFLVSMLFISVIIPLIFKFGVENARILMFGSIMIPTGIGYLLMKIGIELPSMEQSIGQLERMIYISPIILALILILSMWITYGVYKKKDL